MSDRDEFGAFLLGFVVGGLTGAVASLLLAPQPGEQTRTLLKDKAIELGDKVGETVDEARVRAEEITKDARARADALIAEASKKAEKIAADARKSAEDLQQRGQLVLEEQKAKVTKAVKKASEEPPASES